MTALNSAALPVLDPAIAVPRYPRDDVRAGIVHFGVGAFHRSHQAMYLDDLMNQQQGLDWGICGIGLRAADLRIRDAMIEHDCLYTLVLKHPDGRWEPRVIGSIVEYLFAPDDPEAVLARLASPQIRIVSLTITEGGYDLAQLAEGIAPLADVDLPPRNAFDYLARGLDRRRRAGLPPFTIMSCDNLPHNGSVARRALLTVAELLEPELAEWIEQNVEFPDSMVDRITPVTTPEDREQVRARFGLDDDGVVLCEPFSQWVLQDSFGSGRPPLEAVGVQLVTDVEPYELMKLRLLNASHQALCYPGYLAGYRLVHDVARDPLFAGYLLHYMREEAVSTLPPVPGIDLTAYTQGLIDRFSNPEVRDTVKRLCSNSSDLLPKFVLPVLRHQLATGGAIAHTTAILAFWARYVEGIDEQGQVIDIVDSRRDQLLVRPGQEGPAVLANRDVFGDVIDDPRVRDAFARTLSYLHAHGTRATLQALAAASL